VCHLATVTSARGRRCDRRLLRIDWILRADEAGDLRAGRAQRTDGCDHDRVIVRCGRAGQIDDERKSLVAGGDAELYRVRVAAGWISPTRVLPGFGGRQGKAQSQRPTPDRVFQRATCTVVG